MLPVLPLELQLRIIELAVPPLTKRNLGKVRQLSTTLPLVCRAWRDFAYRAVPVVPRFTIEGRDWRGPDPETILDAITASGRVVREVELDLRTLCRGVESGQHVIRHLLRTAAEAWLELPGDEAYGPFYVDELGARFCACHAFTSTTSTTSTSALGLLASFIGVPSIKQLLFTTWQRNNIGITLMWRCYPNLEILGVGVCAPRENDFRMYDINEHSRANRALRHLCLVEACDSKLERCALFSADLPSLTLPPSLATFTVRHPSTLTSRQRSAIAEACHRNDTTFIEQVFTFAQGQTKDEWDIEEWALSVA
ncbi:hypothetical protein Rhopal_006989-T1 [Rhodotorula paludigena]|uniref:F-box domain-containing protein n=1 Tax=Rhodotorula paludigena TaxID=86838 RepID=A0AAV5GWS7_9BASI|nr:hypothetical protein Rhopal_006989-T1 [Rhodotorula paludigena]